MRSTWEPQVKGGLYVLLAVLILPGSVYLILATNTGARLGFQLAAAGLSGFLVIIGIDLVGVRHRPQGPGARPGSRSPSSPATRPSRGPRSCTDFPEEWEKLEVADPEVADAQPVVDGDLTTTARRAGSSRPPPSTSWSGRPPGAARPTRPFGLPDIRPINILHKPHYLVVQVQPVIQQETTPGAAPPRPEADPAAPGVHASCCSATSATCG